MFLLVLLESFYVSFGPEPDFEAIQRLDRRSFNLAIYNPAVEGAPADAEHLSHFNCRECRHRYNEIGLFYLSSTKSLYQPDSESFVCTAKESISFDFRTEMTAFLGGVLIRPPRCYNHPAMKCLVLGLLLALAQTPSPVPRKAPGSAIAQSPKNDKTPSTQSPAAVTPTIDNQQGHPSDMATGRDAQQSLRVRELPPVSIAKDLYDWAFNALLVIVGIGQFWILWRQAKIMRTQAETMAEHATHLKGLVLAAENNSKAAKAAAEASMKQIEMVISKERARIRIEEIEVKFVTMDVRLGPFPKESERIEFKVICHGITVAHVVESYVDTWTSKLADAPSENEVFQAMSLPKVLSQAYDGIKQAGLTDPCMDGIIDRCAKPGEKNRFFLHFRAFIRYTDVFQAKTQWQMESRRVWEVTHHGGENGGFLSWSEFGHHGDTEREVENSN